MELIKNSIQFFSRPVAALQAFIATACFVWLFQNGYTDILCPPENHTLDPRWRGYDVADVKQYFECIGSLGLDHYQFVVSKIDMVFPIVYGSMLFSLMANLVVGRLKHMRWRYALLVLPFATMGFDYWENTNTLALIEQYMASASVDAKAVARASLVTQTKCFLVAVSLLMCMYTVLGWIIAAWRLSQSPLNRLIWIDGLAALLVGAGMLPLRHFLADLLHLPLWLITVQAIVNLCYAYYSLTLAKHWENPVAKVRLLSIANMSYAFLAIGLLCYFYNTCSAWGVAFFVAEVVFIGGLGVLEWKKLKQI